MKLLTIGILTYNRECKLNRLLKKLIHEIDKDKLYKYIDILISDNSEKITNIPRKIIKNKYVIYFKNKTNLGVDRNILNLYKRSNTKYLLFFGDDDLIFKNSLKKLVLYLNNELADAEVLICSHKQGKNLLPFQTNNKYQKLGSNEKKDLNLNIIAETILYNAKLSNILIKKTFQFLELYNLTKKFIGSGFMHTIIALEILLNSAKKNIYQLNFFTSYSIISEVENCRLPANSFSVKIAKKVLSHNFFKYLSSSNIIKIEYLKALKKTEIMIYFYALTYIWKVQNFNEYYNSIKLKKFDKILMSLNIKYILIFFITKYNFFIISFLRFVNKNKLKSLNY
jgi:hypothetical protein